MHTHTLTKTKPRVNKFQRINLNKSFQTCDHFIVSTISNPHKLKTHYYYYGEKTMMMVEQNKEKKLT